MFEIKISYCIKTSYCKKHLITGCHTFILAIRLLSGILESVQADFDISQYKFIFFVIFLYILQNQVVPRSIRVTGNTVLVGTILPASICAIAETAISAICSMG